MCLCAFPSPPVLTAIFDGIDMSVGFIIFLVFCGAAVAVGATLVVQMWITHWKYENPYRGKPSPCDNCGKVAQLDDYDFCKGCYNVKICKEWYMWDD